MSVLCFSIIVNHSIHFKQQAIFYIDLWFRIACPFCSFRDALMIVICSQYIFCNKNDGYLTIGTPPGNHKVPKWVALYSIWVDIHPLPPPKKWVVKMQSFCRCFAVDWKSKVSPFVVLPLYLQEDPGCKTTTNVFLLWGTSKKIRSKKEVEKQSQMSQS